MHPEVPEEQAYFDRALDLRDRLEANLSRAADEATDPQTARDLRRRVGALGVVDPSVAVAFGRIDVDGSQWYIGKSAIWDEHNELVVVNWQAPVAAPFYQATQDRPEGIEARRIYRCAAGNRIRDIEEQVFEGLQRAVLAHSGQFPAVDVASSEVPAVDVPSSPVSSSPAAAAPSSPAPPVPAPLAPAPPPVPSDPLGAPGPSPGPLTPPAAAAGTPMQSNGNGSHLPVRHTGSHSVVRHTGSQSVVRHTGPVDVAFGSGAGSTSPAPSSAPPVASSTSAVSQAPRAVSRPPAADSPRPGAAHPPPAAPVPSPAPPAASSTSAVSPQPGGAGAGPARTPSAEIVPAPAVRMPSRAPARPDTPARSPEPRVSDALLAGLGRSRSGELSDIVATIQAAQYEVITRDIEQLLVVQGGPGTGKTVVGLHRASWMLYHRRDSWKPNDVLIVGPNPTFIRYISSVLPSLGDDEVAQRPITGLGPRVEVTRTDPVDVRYLKGDRRMQRVLLRAVRNRQKPQRGPVDLTVAGRTVRLDGDRVVARAHQLAGQPHNEARRTLRAFVVDEVQTFFSRRGLRGLSGIDDVAQAEATREIDDYLERIWPAMTPQKFLVDLFSTRRRLDAAAVGLLSSDEISMLAMPPDTDAADAGWAVDDIALLDLADSLLNGSPPTYEHIVVDEAQDLSPLQFESIRRRSRTGWMTVLGDLAQATSPWAPESWEETVLHLRRDGVPTEIVELTLGYRLPREVHEVAMRLLPEIAPRLGAPEPVRPSGHPVRILASHVGDVAWRVVEEVEFLLASEGPDGPEVPGTGPIGVIVPWRERTGVTRALDETGIGWANELGADGMAGTRTRVVVLGASEAKGLEFDAVVVVEPAEVAGESPQGLRALFVALTRTTDRLSLVHAEPLPSLLGVESPLPGETLAPGATPQAPVAPSHPAASPWEPVAQAALEAPATPPNGVAPVPSSNGFSPSSVQQPAQLPELAPKHAAASGGLETLDRAMARAVADQLADTLLRYVTPALLPLVLEELGKVVEEEGTAEPEVSEPAGPIQVVDVRER